LPLILLVLVAGVVAGCNTPPTAPESHSTTTPGGSPSGSSQGVPPDSEEPSFQPHIVGRPHILFLGNSHTQRHDVAGTVAAMLRASRPRVHARVTVAPGLLHLNERATDEATQRLLRSRHWDVVVLQAQNYSLSGINDYPNDGSVSLVRSVRERGALPILFAEWPRRGIDETQIILDTYRAIARREPACLPPIPETFDHALARDSRLRLRASDGNHSSAAGAFLASLILYATISGEDVASLPDLAEPRVSPVLQRHLRVLAAAELVRIPAARGCPEVSLGRVEGVRRVGPRARRPRYRTSP
jgi:hypothetical protein